MTGKWLSRAIVSLGLVFGCLALLTALQRQMIFFPQNAAEATLLGEARHFGLQPWRDDSGAIIGWRTPGRESATARMLVLHGNAGYALHRMYYVLGLQSLGNSWEVILFEYPGYGARAGTASADAFRDSATAATELLLEEDERPVYILGESLGSGVASHLAATFPSELAGLLLVTPFTSLADVARRHFPILPIRALLKENFDSAASLRGYQGPVAFLVAGSDEVVPTELGEQLHDGYQGPKWLRIVAGAGHNTLPMDAREPWWGEVSAFLGVDEVAHP